MWNRGLCFPYDEPHLQNILGRLNNGGYLFSSLLDDSSRAYAGSTLCYIRDRDIYDKLVIYEELVTNLEQETKSLFEACNCPVDEDNLGKAMGALDKHSQGNLFDRDSHKGMEFVNQKGWERARQIFKEIKLDLDPQANLNELKCALRK